MKSNKTIWSFLTYIVFQKMHITTMPFHILLITIMFRSLLCTNIRVALHKYYEYDKEPNNVSGTNQSYDRCLKLSIYWLPGDYCRVLFIWIAVLSPFHSVWFRNLLILAMRGALLQARLTIPAPSVTILYRGQVCDKSYRCIRITNIVTTNLETEVTIK